MLCLSNWWRYKMVNLLYIEFYDFFSFSSSWKFYMESTDKRGWDELIPEVLGLIFSNLSLEDVLTAVPRVCKSWYKVVMGPCCWQIIDIEEWSDHQSYLNRIERMLRLLITRSNGSFRKLSVSRLQYDHTFSFIADK